MKKVLLIPDIPHWALDKNARDLIKYNRSNIQFDILYFREFIKEWKKNYDNYDLLYPMYIGEFFPLLKSGICTDKITTGIRSFHRWDDRRTQPPGYNAKPPAKIIRKLKKALLVNTHCKKLWYIFGRYLPIIHTKYTCDLDAFYPEERSQRNRDKLVVGWTGSLTNHPGKRGFFEFIKPVCNEIPEIELRVQCKEDDFVRDNNKMRKFYNSLDLYICASRSEGTPRPVLEAAACGIPVISTDVGIIPELIEQGINGIVVERSYQAIKERLLEFVENRDMLPGMGRAIRQKMEKEFDWNNLIYQWTDFFQYAMELFQLKREGYVK